MVIDTRGLIPVDRHFGFKKGCWRQTPVRKNINSSFEVLFL